MFPTLSALQPSLPLNSVSLFQTVNSGASWGPADTNIPGAAKFLTADPLNPGTIVVSTDTGIYRTTNNGTTWTSQAGPSSAALNRSPIASNYIYAMSGGQTYLSTDGGVTWQYKGYAGTYLANIVADPLTPTTAYAYYYNSGFYVTTNGGASWTVSNTGLPSSAIIYDMVAASDGSLYVYVYQYGIYKSTNQGASWVAVNTGLPSFIYTGTPFGSSAHVLTVSPSNPFVLYFAVNGTVYRTTNGGGSWAPTTGFLPNGAQYVAASLQNPSVVYATSGTYPFAYLSTDGGTTWNSIQTGLGAATLQGFAFDPNNPARAFAFASIPYSAFVTKLNSAGGIVYSTYLSGSNFTYGYGVATDGAGNAFVAGYGSGTGFPVTPGALFGPSTSYTAFITKISDATAACSYSVSPATKLIPSYVQTLTYNVLAPSGCAWTVSSSQSWVSVVAAASGSGTGVFEVVTTANTTGLERVATLTVGSGTATITQVPTSCSYSLSTYSLTVPTAGGSVSFNVNAGSGCDWTLIDSDPSAITVNSGGSGTGSGTVSLTVGPNLSKGSRNLSVQVPETCCLNITQGGTSVPTIAASIISTPAGASFSVSTVSGAGCAPGTYVTPASLVWTASSLCKVSFTDPYIVSSLPYAFDHSTVNGTATSRANPLFVPVDKVALTLNATYVASGGTPGTATHFSVVPVSSSATAGVPIQFSVTALDASNHLVAGFSDPVHVTSSDPFSSLPPDFALPTGVGTFTASLVSIGIQTITATDLLVPLITGTQPITVFAASGLRYIPITPCRVADTRPLGGLTGAFGPPYLGPSSPRGQAWSFPIPTGGCGTFPGALAYSVNATVKPHTTLNYLTVWSTGQSQPTASTLNSRDGRVKANAAIVAAGTSGAISVFASDDTEVILDISGYFVSNANPSGLAFYPLPPCRIMDTRGNGFTGPFGPPSLTSPGASGTSRTVPVLSSTCGVPSTAQAYSLNFTVQPHGSPMQWLTAWPTGPMEPNDSTLNDPTGTVVANAAIVPAGTGGSIDLYVHDTTDVIVDINGYFALPGTGGLSFYPLTPCRVVDTRFAPYGSPLLGSMDVDALGSVCGGTPSAQAYVFNGTVKPATSQMRFLTLYPQGASLPTASNLNAFDGAVTSNMAIVPTTNTQISAYASDPAYLILDLSGYFAP
jgi:photosystem II stability/assembly factor-like uncharacterized protein